MKSRTTLSKSAFYAAVAVCSLMLCRPVMADHNEDHAKNMDKVHEQLNLSPEQKEKLKAHRESHREESKALFQSLKDKKEAMATELAKPDFSESTVRSIHADIKTLQAKMADHRLDGILEVRKILTPEQFKKFQELTKQKKSSWMKERREKRKENKKDK